ncbi:PrpF domain-containing protein [Veillonella ratti]|uniref:PrpF domain-containing protein n=1 Tax=Veillonella ratti TaxID=103892 RepID=UPI000F8E5908|nr:PrpF domain-containing protein [Veillonella ratti]
MDQWSVPCSVYRGGTSRGIFFLAKDVPQNKEKRDLLFMTAIDAWNGTQVDGLGGMTSSTSKVCVVGPSDIDGADVEWTFFQIGLENPIVDEKGTCGNLMTAVGAFAVDKGLIKIPPQSKQVAVNVYHTNLKKMIRIEVPVYENMSQTTGDFYIAGVKKPGAKIYISIMNPGGENTGAVNPLGVKSEIVFNNQNHSDVTFSDVLNPFVFIRASSVGLTGAESKAELLKNQKVFDVLDDIRADMAVKTGLARDVQEAKTVVQNIPKIAIVSEPITYTTNQGTVVNAEDIDIAIKVISMGKLHNSSPASCMYNIAVSSAIKGTLINEIIGDKTGGRRLVRIGHPGGITEVFVDIDEESGTPVSVSVERTARLIMSGEVYVPKEL